MGMITKAQVKHIQSLADKKNREQHLQFVVEGEKMVMELLQTHLRVLTIYALSDWVKYNSNHYQHIEIIEVQLFELEKISSLSTPNKVLAVVELPVWSSTNVKLALLLDGIQDPGNLGSIIRVADWYNIKTIYCSESTVDPFNSKVIQASMGSVFRINVQKCNLVNLIKNNKEIPSFACVLTGKDVNTFSKLNTGYIIIGNEAKGVSEDLILLSNHQVSIQRKGLAESLNAAVAAGIICHCMLS